MPGAADAQHVQPESSGGQEQPLAVPLEDHDLIDSTSARRKRRQQGPAPTSSAVTIRPAKVIWRFVPGDRSRLQRLLRLLFEEDAGQKQVGRW